ncbi:1-deoxy-D-xylulose-5-phosphate synthase [bacterium]|nr:1-deoxy-D-xylulose-5-phosphate synthase [bacterium]
MILETIQSPDDLKKLSLADMNTLVDELREFVISTVCKTGGHLAPNLGAVELTVALHYIFSTPEDKIVWDVGHQAYIHKILTGRRDQFITNRQYGGISGFPKRSESPHDAFGVGHSSTSISAALGLATARDLNGEDNHVLAVIGDGALTGGMAFEALNHAGGVKRDMTVVLNDNRMSISPNVGAVSRYLTNLITNPVYNKIKTDIWEMTGRLPRGSRRIRHLVQRIEASLKSLVVPGSLFEHFGFRYIGPVNGHDLGQLIRVFSEVKKMNGPILVHVLTTKGKGYKFAEENATKFHGLGSFCKETGDTGIKKAPSYTEVFGKALVEEARANEKVVGITAAMAHGTGVIHLAKALPDRFFDVGIAEQHAVTFACGLAAQGIKPVVAIYSTFMQRALDQVIHDAALQKLPVVFVMDRGGLVGADGPTHHGSFDLSFLRSVPDLVLMAPKDENELRDMLKTAINYEDGPIAFRYPRGESLGMTSKPVAEILPIGKGEILEHGEDIAILAIGEMVSHGLTLREALLPLNISSTVINARFVKPLDEDMILKAVSGHKVVITLENNAIIGGFGSAVAELIAEQKNTIIFKRFGLPDNFVIHGTQTQLLEHLHLDVNALVGAVRVLLEQ